MCLVSCDMKCWMVSQWFSQGKNPVAAVDKMPLLTYNCSYNYWSSVWLKRKKRIIKRIHISHHTCIHVAQCWLERKRRGSVVFSGNLGSCQAGIFFLHASSSWVASIYRQFIMVQIVIVNRIIYYKRTNKPKLCVDAGYRLSLGVSGSYDCLLSICRIHFEAKILLHLFLCFVNGHWKV